MGGTGNLPVSVGYQPTATSGADIDNRALVCKADAPFHSAGLVAQRHGQVARATQNKTGRAILDGGKGVAAASHQKQAGEENKR